MNAAEVIRRLELNFLFVLINFVQLVSRQLDKAYREHGISIEGGKILPMSSYRFHWVPSLAAREFLVGNQLATTALLILLHHFTSEKPSLFAFRFANEDTTRGNKRALKVLVCLYTTLTSQRDEQILNTDFTPTQSVVTIQHQFITINFRFLFYFNPKTSFKD